MLKYRISNNFLSDLVFTIFHNITTLTLQNIKHAETIYILVCCKKLSRSQKMTDAIKKLHIFTIFANFVTQGKNWICDAYAIY